MTNETTMSTPEGVPYEYWTEVDGDLKDCPGSLATVIREARLGFVRYDEARVPLWHDPEGIDVIEDLGYVDDADEVRGHRLDLYLPHDAVIRGGRTLPVYVDVHGGGFVYGYKELNRNFCTHLAERGFAVFSLNYRPLPQTDFVGQLRDIAQALTWIREHRHEYPIAQDGVWMTGDSAGGCLAFFTTVIEHSPELARQIGVTPSGVNVLGAALISGVYDMLPYIPREDRESRIDPDHSSLLHKFSDIMLGCVKDLDPRALDLGEITSTVDLPPLFLNTSSDDFIQNETLRLAMHLAEAGKDFELHDWKTGKGESLGHVFPVCMTWLEESGITLDMIRDFTYARL
ncbi:esterase [Bifidobacterium lemurum]|uniref:Esterase n=1 Tax=Bifidobacterium lemurum TaxID=1603886 RepID=A0A261FLZ1_9BIFI|nr:alpha/beta hydrolase [Bifidobacterium lemurum]OZG60169.1 esterase [Bifidobacterium lemurum]QOL34071.1 alpha/beta hydrolase [Bifidobacterium lemurum]